jgi:hypothetical protein
MLVLSILLACSGQYPPSLQQQQQQRFHLGGIARLARVTSKALKAAGASSHELTMLSMFRSAAAHPKQPPSLARSVAPRACIIYAHTALERPHPWPFDASPPPHSIALY